MSWRTEEQDGTYGRDRGSCSGVSRHGGHLIHMLKPRRVGRSNLVPIFYIDLSHQLLNHSRKHIVKSYSLDRIPSGCPIERDTRPSTWYCHRPTWIHRPSEAVAYRCSGTRCDRQRVVCEVLGSLVEDRRFPLAMPRALARQVQDLCLRSHIDRVCG
jgi:hypothetical protein